MKIISSLKVGTILVAGALLLTGCGQSKSASSTSSAKSSTSKQTSVKASSAKRSQTSKQSHASSASSSKQTTTLWSTHKANQLNTFINQWAPTMQQSYVKYDGKQPLKISTGMVYPTDFSKVNVEGQKTTIGMSTDGKGSNEYNVVAIYNYDGTEPPLPNHITYFFAFHNGKPVALVDQSTNGTPNLTATKNTKVQSNFEQIADNSSKLGTSTKVTTSTAQSKVVTDPKLIGIMVHIKVWPTDDVSKESMLSVYHDGDTYNIGIGNAVATIVYQIKGDAITYWKMPTYGEPNPTKHTVSLKALQAQYYSTASEKKIVDDTANQMPGIQQAPSDD